MAVVVHPSTVASPAIHDHPTLRHAEFKTHPINQALHTHNARYNAALEAEHSRDLYLQGAMAVGQIARLLEGLCADLYDTDDHDEDEDNMEETAAEDELSTHQSAAIGIHKFVSYKQRNQIAAWARAVSPADGELSSRVIVSPRR